MSKFNHRMGRTTLNVLSGENRANQQVVVNQVKHAFLFGCSEFSTLPYVGGEMDAEQHAGAEKRYDLMADLMNYVTLPFYWGRYEPVEGQPDRVRMRKAAEYLKARGMTLKGHPLCWHTSCAPWLLEKTNDEIYRIQLERITRDITEYKGLIDMWDVINEAVIMPLFDKYDNAITRICKERGRISLIRDLFKTAQQASPVATLLINDFETSESYDILIEGCLEAGIKIEHIGIQSHQHQGWWGPEKTAEILERFSRFQLPIHFTELNLVSGHIMPKSIVDLNDYKCDHWPSTEIGEARQAFEAAAFYEQLLENPWVQSITWWSFMDGLWLGAPSGLVSKDNTAKPAYKALHDRIKGQWWVNDQIYTTDANGNITVEGWKGVYTASINGQQLSFNIE